jgi:hypothetical protein
LTYDELRTLGEIVPFNDEEKKSKKGHYSVVQNLFFYYHARPEIFKKFEDYLNLSALKAGYQIKKISTFRGTTL